MIETIITIEDAARSLPELVERVQARGETALLVKAGRPLAKIIPVPVGEQVADDLIPFLRRWRNEHPVPDDELAGTIEESRKAIQTPHDPWA